MRNLFRLRGLNWRFRFKTLTLIWAIRLGLWLLPFRKMRRIVDRLAIPPAGVNSPRWPAPGQIAQVVTIASRYVPEATCLTQAMVTRVLLGRYGHQATLRIGVGRGDENKLRAHAWVESNGAVVIGGKESELVQDYVAFPALEGNQQ